jgi:hypothetical protein
MRFHPTFEIPIVLIELAAIGSHYAFPELPHALGLALFWGGLAGLLIWASWFAWRILHAPRAAIPTRDVPVGNAISYLCFRTWDRSFFETAGVPSTDANAAVAEFIQAAADDRITIWGRTTAGAVFEKIPADFWRKNRIEWFGLLKGKPTTESTDRLILQGLAHETTYSDLMTSKAQAEAAWPKRRRRLIVRKPWEMRDA